MIFWQSLGIAIEMLRLHKLRSFLTMLGVIIGVMSVTTIVMVSTGFRAFMANEIEKVGADTIAIFYDPGGQFRGPRGAISGLKNEDRDYLMERIPELDIASSILSIPIRNITAGEREMRNAEVFGTDQYFHYLNRLGLAEGRYLSEADLANRANVALIGKDARDQLFPDGRALGRFITMKGITLEVIGVLETIEIMGQSTGRQVLIPITTAQDKWLGGETVSFITTRPKAGVSVQEAMDKIWRALMVRSGNRPLYRVDSRESILNIFGMIIGAAGAVLAAIAALSLLVGGIGIMNIMLVSVTERTREVGLRKAVGAKSGAILTQFLIESATLSLVGGLIGMGIAYGLGSLVTLFTAIKQWPSPGGMPTPFPLPAALMSAAFSAFIGVIFGLYPAARAARLSPIDALRTE